MALYVGTNYHPHDWMPERWKKDIDLMKQAGFQVVRLGHLCWDSYEPMDGVYTFEWFDDVMDAFHRTGIQVILDISTRPAPVWVHRLCPGCDIFSPEGNRQAALRRYMEDVDDPAYQFYALRFAQVLVHRYKEHPALMAFGLCNEQGAGYLSYSEAAKQRFQKWLMKKYGDVRSLNLAWNTQRWSRRLTSFQEIALPENAVEKGSPESYLDMRRFFGDGVLNFMIKLKETVEREAPGRMHTSNHVAEGSTPGFDYLKGCRDFVDFPGIGFYPGLNPENEDALMYALVILQHRLAELNKPMWCIEFQTGDFGCYAGKEGVIRMYALLCLAYRTQMALAWTWRSMLGGEEQFFFGLLDHDGTCSRKYREFARIATDYRMLEVYDLPYLPIPETALAYCYENNPVYEYGANFYRTPYMRQIMDAFKVFYRKNLDCNFVDLRNMSGNYRLLLIPGHAIMDSQMAETVKSFVAGGGIAVMTAYSAKVDGTGTVFDTFQPGFLSDVFGIRVAGFERVQEYPAGEKKEAKKSGFRIQKMGTDAGSETAGEKNSVCYEVSYWENLEMITARVYACYEKDQDVCAVSVNQYGQGKAFYTSAETNTQLLEWLYGEIAREEGLCTGIETPEGVVAREIGDMEILYVNTTGMEKKIRLQESGRAVLKGKILTEELVLEPFDGDLIVSCHSTAR